MEWRPYSFGEDKEEIENQIAQALVGTVAGREDAEWCGPLTRLPQDDLDFDVVAADGTHRYVELTEITPVGMTRGHDTAPNQFIEEHLSDRVIGLIRAKEKKYEQPTRERTVLVVYTTDYHAVLTERVVRLVRWAMLESPSGFYRIYTVHPFMTERVEVELIVPAPDETWKNFRLDGIAATAYVSIDLASISSTPPWITEGPEPQAGT
jgi:hypothetical protein